MMGRTNEFNTSQVQILVEIDKNEFYTLQVQILVEREEKKRNRKIEKNFTGLVQKKG